MKKKMLTKSSSTGRNTQNEKRKDAFLEEVSSEEKMKITSSENEKGILFCDIVGV